MKHILQVLLVGAASMVASAAQAVTVNWVDWTSQGNNQVQGTLDTGTSNVGVTFSGPYSFAQTDGGSNYWLEDEPRPFTGGSVENAPPPVDIIALSEGGVKTITFSEAVEDIYIALVSWNNNDVQFSADFEVISLGCGIFGCGTITPNGTGDGFTSSGEVHGVLHFSGVFTELSFTHNSEFWHGFTIGIGGADDPTETPEPAALGLVGVGIAGAAFARRRRHANGAG